MGITAIKDAIRDNDIPALSHEIKQGCHPIDTILDFDLLITPLHYACIYNKPEIIRYLVSRGANFYARTTADYTVLHLVCMSACGQDLSTIQFLISSGVNPFATNHKGASAFHLSCRHSSKEIVCYLGNLIIKTDANLHAPDYDGYTPLHYACYKSDLEIIKWLISVGADIYATNDDGDNAFNIACKYDQKEKVEYLGSVMLLK